MLSCKAVTSLQIFQAEQCLMLPPLLSLWWCLLFKSKISFPQHRAQLLCWGKLLSNHGGDNSSTADSFPPLNLLWYLGRQTSSGGWVVPSSLPHHSYSSSPLSLLLLFSCAKHFSLQELLGSGKENNLLVIGSCYYLPELRFLLCLPAQPPPQQEMRGC